MIFAGRGRDIHGRWNGCIEPSSFAQQAALLSHLISYTYFTLQQSAKITAAQYLIYDVVC
jgi:hypothetical protein